MSIYVEVELTLDSLDLNYIESLIKSRLKEYDDVIAELKLNGDLQLSGLTAALANEQIGNYKSILKKIRLAKQDVKAKKKAADDAYFASLKKRRAS